MEGIMRALSVLTLLVLTLVVSSTISKAEFVDVTPEPLRTLSGCHGVAWGDFNGDTQLDFVVGRNETNPWLPEPGCRLFRNMGTDGFREDLGHPDIRNQTAFGVTWGDYDNDGDLDLFVASQQHNALFINDGTGNFTKSPCPTMLDSLNSYAGAWADHDRDGWLDLAVVNWTTLSMFHNDQGGCFTDSLCGVSSDLQGGQQVSWADYDNDGDLDLFVCQYPQSRLLRNEGNSCFLDVSSILQIRLNSHGVAWGDYNNDGYLDLCYTHPHGVTLLRNVDGQAFVDAGITGLPDFFASGVTWGDYDNDGWLDLYVACYNNDPNRLLHNAGGSGFLDVTPEVLADSGASVGATWADYDEDGDLDLLWANTSVGSHLCRNDNPPGNHWLDVSLWNPGNDEVPGNVTAVGARVRIVAGGRTQIREVSGGGSVESQDSPVLHFGLGTAYIVDELTVIWPFWPNGNHDPRRFYQVFRDVPVDQVLTLLLIPAAVEGEAGGSAVYLSSAPNPVGTSARVSWGLPRQAHIRLTAHDVSGRVVAVLVEGVSEAGHHSVSWSAEDDQSRRLPVGVYFLRLAVNGRSAVRRVVVLR
jgi:hypothetical protein